MRHTAQGTLTIHEAGSKAKTTRNEAPKKKRTAHSEEKKKEWGPRRGPAIGRKKLKTVENSGRARQRGEFSPPAATKSKGKAIRRRRSARGVR